MSPVGPAELARFFFHTAGRISRREYALGVGFIFAASAAILVAGTAGDDARLGFAVLLALPFVAAQVVLTVKRCHDTSLSGGYAVLLVIPMVGLWWLVALAVIRGNVSGNAYGPAPRFAPEPGMTER